MNAAPSSPHADRDALKRAAAEAAVQLVENDMIVGLGSGSTAAFAVEALARRRRQGLRFVGIPTSERTAAQAKAADIPLTSFSEHRQIDLTIDGADEVERGTLNLIKGLGGALLREKIVAAASHRLAIVVDGSKMVDRLGTRTPVPVEVVDFGLEATRESLEVLGASARARMSSGAPFVTDSGNRILDCDFGRISDPARLEERIGRIVGVVESGLFISRADPVFVADATGVHRLDSARAHRGSPPILVVMGVSGSGKSTIAEELSARLGWPFEEGDSLHPESNIAKMHAGIPLTDADRLPWLERVAAWIDGQRAKKQPGIVTCSALKRSYRQIIIGDRPEVRLVYLRGGRNLIAEHLAGRHGHFMPSALLQSQIDTLEEPDPGEDPLTADGARLLVEQYLREPVDMITGIRSAQKATQAFRPLHQWGMSIFAAVLNSVFRFKPLDLFSGLRLFSRRFYKHVPVLSRGFELEIELTIQAVDKGFAQTEIPVPFRSRAKGSASKLKTTRDGLRIFRLLVVLFRDYRPLTFFGHIAAVAALLGLSAGCIPIAEYLTTGLVNRLPLAVLAASLVTLSIIIGLVGLLLEANLRYHREAYHIQLRKYGAPAVQRTAGEFPRVIAG